MDTLELETSKNANAPGPTDGQIPTIKPRAATFDGQADPDPETQSRLHSLATPSLESTPPETASSVSSEDESIQWSDEEKQQMVKDVFAQLDQMVGMEKVKEHFREIATRIEVWRKQGINLRRKRFHMMFLGNPGTGKTTVARLYATLLLCMGVLRTYNFAETSGAHLTSDGINVALRIMKRGVVFIDEAYQLTLPHQPGGRRVLDHIHLLMENQRSNLIFIFAGYKKDMEAFVEHDSGMAGRIPDKMYFEDFTSDELLTILKRKINEDYGDKMKIEAHPDDKDESRYLRIVADRLSRGRENRGFGNARSVENQLQRIQKRQIERLKSLPEEERDYFLLSREDLIGPHPSVAKFQSREWTELQSLIGLNALKAQCNTIIGLSETNYERELQGLDPEMLSLNGLFMGSPGTGKTTVAKLYGRILSDLGLLSNGEVVIKTPSDFVGETLGSSEARTRTILASTIGKVLIIDEAYGLGAANSGSGNASSANTQDSFRAGVIDTLVSEIHGAPGEDRCVLLLGYEEKLREMFQRSNPGLSSRFNYSSPFHFEDFTPDELMEILHFKMKKQGLTATPEALDTARDVLERASLNPEYGNARAVENCLQVAKQRHQERLQAMPAADRDYTGQLQPADFDPDYEVKSRGSLDVEQLLAGQVSKSVIKKISRIQKQALMAKWTNAKGFRDVVPTNFIFRGPPGTGKTTTAKLMGKVFYNLGYLATDETIEYSVRDFIAPFVGQTRQKTKDQLAKARGKVLIIENAFQMLKGPYELEALQELITCLQSDEYAGKLVVILVGYTEEMGLLVHSCPPLAALCPNEVKFSLLKPKDCLKLLSRGLEKLDVSAPFLKDESCEEYEILEKHFKVLLGGPMFGNAKDIESLAQSMKTALFDGFYKKNHSQFTSHGPQNLPKLPELSRSQASSCILRLVKQRRCMKTHTPFLPDAELHYSDDDPQFARAYDHAQMPKIEIRIESTVQIVTQSHTNQDNLYDEDLDMFDESSSVQHNQSLPQSTLNISVGFMGGYGSARLPIHGSEKLQYYKPKVSEQPHGYIEESDDEDKYEEGPAAAAELENKVDAALASQEEPKKARTEPSSEFTTKFAILEEHPLDSKQITRSQEMEAAIAREEKQRYRNMLRLKYPFGPILEERTKRALRDLGYCSHGYAWRRDNGRHVCEGGCHYTYDFVLRDYMHKNDM